MTNELTFGFGIPIDAPCLFPNLPGLPVEQRPLLYFLMMHPRKSMEMIALCHIEFHGVDKIIG
jgi:hypothetical protein